MALVENISFYIEKTYKIASYATHIVGGDISYKCTGNKTYEFTLTVYTECGSTAILENLYPIYYFSVSQGIPQATPKSFMVTKISEAEESVFCLSVITNCIGGTARGIKRVIYKGSIDLNAFAAASDWNFYWRRQQEVRKLLHLLCLLIRE